MITPDILAIVMFISTLLLLLFGFPVAFTLAGSALIFAFIGELLDIFNECNNIKKPKAIIANTIKGKGFSFSENNNDWHHSILSKSFYEKAIKELG